MLETPLFKGMPTGPEAFGEYRACLGYGPAPRPTLKKPYATLTRLVRRATNTLDLISWELPAKLVHWSILFFFPTCVRIISLTLRRRPKGTFCFPLFCPSPCSSFCPFSFVIYIYIYIYSPSDHGGKIGHLEWSIPSEKKVSSMALSAVPDRRNKITLSVVSEGTKNVSIAALSAVPDRGDGKK